MMQRWNVKEEGEDQGKDGMVTSSVNTIEKCNKIGLICIVE